MALTMFVVRPGDGVFEVFLILPTLRRARQSRPPCGDGLGVPRTKRWNSRVIGYSIIGGTEELKIFRKRTLFVSED